MFSSVELRDFRVFLVLAEELHYGHAAQRLCLTTSRVSQIIRRLEARIGGRLFERTSRRVMLTPLGQRFRDQLVPGYEQLEHAYTEIRAEAAGTSGTLRIGMYATALAGRHWTAITDAFTARHPECVLEYLDTGLQRDYLEWLRSAEVDLLIVRLPIHESGITVGPVLSSEPRILLVGARDPLAQRQAVRYDDLADRLVSDVPAFPREMIDAFIPPSTSSGTRLRRIANRSFEEAMMRVASGTQVHPTVPSFLDRYRHPDVVAIPLTDLPPSETALAWMSGNRSPKITAFVQAAADTLAAAP